MKDNYLTYSIEPKYTQYLVGNDLERPGQIKPEVISIYQGSPGPKGDPGEPGSAATVAIGNVTSGSTPSVVNTGTETDAVLDFVLVPGEQGQIGPAGQSATISVGTTTTGEPGTDASVTNSGTASAAVLNFTIPRGSQGVQGNPGVGVPQGGTAGQILAKIDGTDYNTEWIDAPSGGNVTHDVVLKVTVTASQTLTFRGVATTIDWGDGNTTSPASKGSTHTYENAGNYVVIIDGITEWGDTSQSGINRSILSANVITEAEINTDSIGAEAFRECTNLTSVKAFRVNTLGGSAFYNCSGLSGDINKMIPTWNIVNMKTYVFYGTNFTGVFDASHIISASDSEWKNNFNYAFPSQIRSIKMPEMAVSLPISYGNNHLESLVIPEGTRVITKIEGISSSKFYSARIPCSVQTLLGPIFSETSSLKEIYVEDGAFSSFNSWMGYDNNETYNELSSKYSIGPHICNRCSSLVKVRLPEGMKAIGSLDSGASNYYSSFSGAPLTEFNIPSTVEVIANICQDCTNLTSMTFPASVNTIKTASFSGCTSLATIHMLGDTPPTLSSNCFTNCPITAVYVPASSVSDYQSHSDWSRFSSVIQAEP